VRYIYIYFTIFSSLLNNVVTLLLRAGNIGDLIISQPFESIRRSYSWFGFWIIRNACHQSYKKYYENFHTLLKGKSCVITRQVR